MSKAEQEKFERNFEQVNASWKYEDAGINDKGKELIRKRLANEITQEEFNEEVIKLSKETQNL